MRSNPTSARRHTALLPLAALALALALGGCAGSGGRVALGSGVSAKTLNVAEAALHSGDPATALHVAAAVLAHAPHDRQARRVQAEALYAMGHVGRARAIDHGLYAETHDPADLLAYARCLVRSDPKRAAAALHRYLAQRPGDTAALTDLGVADDLQGRSPAAQAAYRRALAQDGSNLAAKVNLALSLALSGQRDAALPMLAAAASQAPANPRIRGDYAAVLAMDGQKQRAERLLASDLPPAEAELAASAYAAAR